MPRKYFSASLFGAGPWVKNSALNASIRDVLLFPLQRPLPDDRELEEDESEQAP